MTGEIDKDSFWWVFDRHPLPWHVVVIPSGGYVYYDKNDKLVDGDLILKCINEMQDSLRCNGCPLCGDIR